MTHSLPGIRRLLAVSLALPLSLGVIGGCTAVQPWEKGVLGQDTMQAGGPVPELGVIDQHVYTSKEATKGGTGVGGGGCGCN